MMPDDGVRRTKDGGWKSDIGPLTSDLRPPTNAVAIIPARGGSKRIPRKNIKEFCGKPMIAWSIEESLKVNLFDRVVVSTDDQEIAEVARQYGAEVPFMRPPELANDFIGTDAVFLHALEWLKEHDQTFTYACCIYATAPFIQRKYLQEGLVAVSDGSTDSAFSVTSYPYPIFRSLKINEAGYTEMFWPEHKMTRSQDLPEVYHDAGQFYWVDCENYLTERDLWGKRCRAIILPQYLVQDIDTEADWVQAELMYHAIQNIGE